MSPSTRIVFVVLAFCLTVLWQSPVSAQSIWQSHTQPNRFGLEFLVPNLEDGDLDFPSSTVTFFLHYKAQGQLSLVFELPMATGNTTFMDTDTEFGNPYFGLESILAEPAGFFGEFGIRPSIMNVDLDTADLIGLLTHQDAWEAFLEATSVSAAVNYVYKNPQGQGYRIRVSPVIWIPEGDGDAEFWLNYSGQVFYEGPGAGVQAGLSLRTILTEDEFLQKSTYAEMGLRGAIHFQNVRPGVHFKLPLGDDLFRLVDFVWGFQVEFLPGS